MSKGLWSEELGRFVSIPDRLACEKCGADESRFVDHATVEGRVVCGECGATIVEEEGTR